MLAGSGVSVLPRTASNAFSCTAKEACFLKKRNGLCTSQTMSEAKAVTGSRMEKDRIVVVVASRRMNIFSRTIHPRQSIADFAARRWRKVHYLLTKTAPRLTANTALKILRYLSQRHRRECNRRVWGRNVSQPALIALLFPV